MKKISLTIYVVGFVLSLLCTLAAFSVVWLHLTSGHSWPPHTFIIPAILLLALLQCAVQLICFLHLTEGSDARERTFSLGVAALVVFILVSGSLWIMTHLNARMMQDSGAMQQYMDSQSGL